MYFSHGAIELGMICNMCLWYFMFIYANFNAITLVGERVLNGIS